MKLQPIDGGWRIDLRPDHEVAVEFEKLEDARDFADMIDHGTRVKRAVETILRRRERQEKREQ